MKAQSGTGEAEVIWIGASIRSDMCHKAEMSRRASSLEKEKSWASLFRPFKWCKSAVVGIMMMIDQRPSHKWAALGLVVGLSVGRQCKTNSPAEEY